MFKRLIIIVLAIPLFFCSCSISKNEVTSEKKIESLENTNGIKSTPQHVKVELPEGFTIDKIKDALLEYINYRLYLYPVSILDDNKLDIFFDNYIGKSVDVEIRLYYKSKNMVCAHTSIGSWLTILSNKNGFVFCNGQIKNGEYGYPDNPESYQVLEKYSITIPEPHKPNYGTSERKDKMIKAFEEKLNWALKDIYGYEEGAKADVDVYITNFYEYEGGAHAWFISKKGRIIEYPISFIEENGELTIQPLKGYTMKSINEFNEFGRYQFEKDIKDAVKHFKYVQ